MTAHQKDFAYKIGIRGIRGIRDKQLRDLLKQQRTDLC